MNLHISSYILFKLSVSCPLPNSDIIYTFFSCMTQLLTHPAFLFMKNKIFSTFPAKPRIPFIISQESFPSNIFSMSSSGHVRLTNLFAYLGRKSAK